MDEGTRGDRIVDLGRNPPDPPPPTPHRGLHAIAVAGMTFSAVGSLIAFVALITVRWPGSAGRPVTAALFVCIVAFLAFASTAVFTAARGTYEDRSGDSVSEEHP